MAYQDVLFGSFTLEEASDLCTSETSALQFVWLDKRKSAKPKCAAATSKGDGNTCLTIPPSSINEDEGRSFSPSLLSPNIPPNPPTSPVDDPSNGSRRRMGAQQANVALKKLNVNAVPFVPSHLLGDSTTLQASMVSKVSKKLDFEPKGEISKQGSAEERGIPWGSVNCQIPPPQPCGNIQTSGQATSASQTTSVGGPRESEQSQCQSQDDHAPCPVVGAGAALNFGGDLVMAEKVSPLEPSVAPLEMPPSALLSGGDSSPLDSTSQTSGDMWPNIPSSPPPPLPLPPSHYQKTDLPRLNDLSYAPVSNDSSPFERTSSSDNHTAMPLASSGHSATQNSPMDHVKGGSENSSDPGTIPARNGNSQFPSSIPPGNGIGHLGSVSPVLQDVESPSTVLNPMTSSTISTTSTTEPMLAPLPVTTICTAPSSSVISPSVPSSVTPTPGIPSSVTPTSSVPSSVTPTSGGAWGSNRVKSWATVFKEPKAAAGQRQFTPTSKPQTKTVATPTSGEGGVAQERSSSDPESVKAGGGMSVAGRGGDFVGGPVCDIPLRNLGEQLRSWTVCHRAKHILPRGLINSGNWCYVHAPLQALLSIPSMWHLFRSLNPNPPPLRGPSSTPFSDAMCRFFHEFQDSPKSSAPHPSNPQGGFKKKKGHRVDFVSGEPFQPKYVYDMLQKVRSNLSYKGRQEDAEEFLGCLLDGLHEEMVSAGRLVRGQDIEDTAPSDSVEAEDHTHISSPSLSTTSSSCDLKQQPELEVEGADEWEQVGPKNKAVITRQTSFSESPITEIFGGKSRSALHRQGARESATMEPFFSLQLDIQSDGITSVKEALENLATKETVHMSEVDAYKRITLARLPPVLVFHLKRFVFTSSGSQKVFKFISYSMDMEIAKELLSPTVKNKVAQGQRSYRLWAVVYHHGKTATGGHYTCDAFHSGSGGWIRVDDGLVKPIPEDFVLTPGGGIVNKTAYLLFYRRMDTVV